MSEENLEEWDASFLEELIQVEEFALSCSYVNQNNRTSSSPSYLPPEPPLSSSHNQHLHFPPPPSRTDSISYSPPRELSQRPTDLDDASNSADFIAKCATPSTPVRRGGGSSNVKDLEIELLKKELGRVSKQLADLEQECSELKKERNKEDQLTVSNSNNEVKVANLKDISINDRHGISLRKSFNDQIGLHTVKSSCQAIGVQTDLNASLDFSEKLQDIWRLPSEQKFGRNLTSKLFAVCSEDIYVLFGFINMSSPSKTMELHAVKSSADMASKSSIHPFLSAEAAKVSRFYSALKKTSSGMLQLQALFESLFDLCTVENVVIVYRSLHILHVLLKHLVTSERESRGRENFLVEHLHSGSDIDDIFGYETRDRGCIGMDETFSSCMPTGVIPSEAKYLCKKGSDDTSSASMFSHINWIYLFEFMRLILMKSSEECVRLEAVSIMNVILMRSDAYTDREKFGLSQVFESISQILKKEAGLLVQKEAVHVLYLLLNCPKLLVTFCSGCATEASAGAANDKENTAAIQGFTMILEGLADCIACSGNSLQALELRKNAVTLLAFVVSSGKSGFEILVNNKLSREANFLTLIMQLLASEIDLEATVNTKTDESFRARTLLIREVLILLNRLVSNPVQSATVLRLLTNSRDMVSLTIDVANRLSRKEPELWLSDSASKQMRESEIVDLGRMFKRRVSTYLGE
ncbi:SENSITIVE TO UV 2 [Hibiscus trionum]|uniref:SENSITIVE TO UV 2 n=1 Tax=Hibiscus trionum TaxID=183268 RepID=A0A9W7J220_HIBTR|nr:SENSITIVE TO UV 2 [Hibiscus trionum]